MDHRIVFMGTPDFSVPTLVKLAERFQVIGVITQPDRPAGRGRKMLPSAVKTAAKTLDLDIAQPENANSDSALEIIREWNPDLICVAAFGQILKPALLGLPRFGCLNVHASLLPRWRGASPIQAAILHGDTHSGVTIMKMEAGLDDGPILVQKSIEILPGETGGSLSDRLADLGGRLLVDTITAYLEDKVSLQSQDNSLATYAPLLKKNSGALDFEKNAALLARTIRAYSPWPGTFTSWNGTRLIIHKAQSVAVSSPGPGVFTIYNGLPAIGTTAGLLVLELLQLAGKNKVTGADFLNGNPGWLNH